MNTPIALIESLDYEGRGVAHVDGKTIFIDGALPGEQVTYHTRRRKANYEVADVADILTRSHLRIEPDCKHFGVCGGCAIQHLDVTGQVAAKQRMLEDNFWHIGKTRPERMLPAIYGPSWGYRHKARLRVRYVAKKGGVLVGFNEKATSFVADMDSCKVLPPHLSQLIPALKLFVNQLSVRERLPQIEVAVGEHSTVLVLRILEPLQASDSAPIKAFADKHGVEIWTQSKGPETVQPYYPLQGPGLSYSLPEFDLRYPFKPNEFTQVNPHINRVMLRRSMQLLQPQAGERIADFFCGLGNFTLPIARSGATVFGMEGSAALVTRAHESAALNGLQGQVEYQEADLFQMTPELLASLGHFDKWLVDPPRDGAMELMKSLPDVGADAVASAHAPQRIVYVSCNPSTLARDAGVLVHAKGYRLVSSGVINMFPHTAHVESIALFERV